jgi:hypothetical protein
MGWEGKEEWYEGLKLYVGMKRKRKVRILYNDGLIARTFEHVADGWGDWRHVKTNDALRR